MIVAERPAAGVAPDPAPPSLLRNRGFLALLGGFFLSLLAPWCQRTMVLIWVYALTGSGVGVSLVGLAEALPLLLLAPVAGVFVDRWHRARTMATVVVIQAVLLLPLLAVHDRGGMPIILVVTLLINAASQFFQPAAGAALPVVVGRKRIGQANSLLQISNSVVPVIAPGLAAVLYAAIGPRRLALLLGAIYLLAVPMLLRVPAPRPAQAERTGASVGREMLAGLRYVIRSRLLVSLIVVVFVAMLGVGGLSVLDVVFVSRALHQPSDHVGLLLTVTGLGQLTGGIVIWLLSRRVAGRYHRLMGASMLLSGLGTFVYAHMPTLLFAAMVLFCVGLVFPPIIVAFNTMMQSAAEDQYMGRVMSLVGTSMALAIIVSMTASGVLTDLFGVRAVIGAGGVMLMIAGIVALFLIRAMPAARPAPADGTVTEPVAAQAAPRSNT